MHLLQQSSVTRRFRQRPGALPAAVLSILAVLLLAACGTNPAATPAASTSTSTIPAVESPQPMPEDATPTKPPQEGNVEARVTEFEVWQDYMPMVPAEGAPLYGVVSLEITHTEKLTPQIVTGTVTLDQAGGDTIVADMPLTLQQQSDDLGMMTPGAQSAVFTFGPGTTQVQLTEGEMIGGAVTLSVGGEQVQLDLPEVALYFTH